MPESLKAAVGSSRAGTVAGLAALAVWSSSVPLIRGLSESFGTLTGAAVSATLGGAIGLAYAFFRGQSPASMLRLPGRYLIGCGGCFAVCVVSIYAAVGWAPNRSATLVVGLVNYLWPALTVAFSVPILHRRANWRLAPGCLLAVGGSAVAVLGGEEFCWSEFSGQGLASLSPLALAGAAAVSWALYSNLARRWGAPGGGAVPLFILASAGGFWLLRIGRQERILWSLKGVLELAVLSTFSLALAYALWDHGMRRGNHLLLSVCSYFVPVASVALTCAYLGVVPGRPVVAGCALVVAGAWVCKSSLRDPE